MAVANSLSTFTSSSIDYADCRDGNCSCLLPLWKFLFRLVTFSMLYRFCHTWHLSANKLLVVPTSRFPCTKLSASCFSTVFSSLKSNWAYYVHTAPIRDVLWHPSRHAQLGETAQAHITCSNILSSAAVKCCGAGASCSPHQIAPRLVSEAPVTAISTFDVACKRYECSWISL